MTRILFFVSSMEAGGAERVAALLCNRWAEQGHEVTLALTFSGSGTCHYPIDERVQVIYLANRVGTTRKTPLSMLQRLRAMRMMVSETRANVVVSFLTHVNIASLLATRGLGVPVVVSERTHPPLMPLSMRWHLLRRIAYPWATYVVMQTSGGLQWLAQTIPRACGIVIPNPCVLPLPSGEPKVAPDDVVSPTRHLLLAVGRLEELKQFAIVIRVFSGLAPHFPDWDLAILGEGAVRTNLETQVTQTGLASRIHMPGRVGNLGDWYNRGDLFCMTSRFEGFPNTLLEAMAHGLPAVSFDCPTGPSEMIDDGVNGYLVPHETGAEGVSVRLKRLMEDRELRITFGQRATGVTQRFSFGKVNNTWNCVLGVKDVDP